LYGASKNGYFEIVKYLVEKGADINKGIVSLVNRN
jgi:ankyrin repeat protein